MSKKKTQEEFINEVKSKNTHNLDFTNFIYNGKDAKSTVKCLDCGHVWDTTPKILLGNHGCPQCGEKIRHIKKRLTQEKVLENIKNKYGDKYILDKLEYIKAREKILIGCKKHGYFSIKYHDLMNDHGCPFCNESILESILRLALDKSNIEYIPQHSFDWMKTSIYSRLSYDFYLPKYNIAIECQGRQHFENVIAFGGEDEFKKVLERDKNKLKLTNEHGVKLIYFLNKRFNKYMKEDDIYFNDVEDIISYLNKQFII